MTSLALFAKRINNGQSEIWFGEDTGSRRVVATNGIVYPVRTLAAPEESETFHKVFGEGVAEVPQAAVSKIVADFKL